jgi:hypothetical protein
VNGDGVAAARLWSRAIGIGQTIRQLGWTNGCLYAIGRVLEIASGNRVCIHKYYLVAQPVAKKCWLPPHRGQGFEIRRVVEFDPLVRQFPRPEHAAPYRFNQGAVCIAALKAGALVGFLWLTLGPYQEDEVRCRYVPLPAGKSAWDFDVHVEPEYRNGIVFLRLWDEANLFLAAHQVQWSLSRISAFNSGSILSHARMGARRIGAVTFLSIGSWQIAASTVAPYFHFSGHAGSFPTYALHARNKQANPAADPDVTR